MYLTPTITRSIFPDRHNNPIGSITAERGVKDVVQIFNFSTWTFFYIACENLDEMRSIISLWN